MHCNLRHPQQLLGLTRKKQSNNILFVVVANLKRQTAWKTSGNKPISFVIKNVLITGKSSGLSIHCQLRNPSFPTSEF